MLPSLCSFARSLPAWPSVGCMSMSENTKRRLGEICVKSGPFSSSWSAQNLNQALVPAGVTVKKGRELVTIYCPLVISDAGLFNTYKHLLPDNARGLPGERLGCVALPSSQQHPSGAAQPTPPDCP